MERLILWAVHRYVGGPARSWLFSGLALLGYRQIRKLMSRQEVVEVATVKAGHEVVVEHVTDTHHVQLGQERRVRRAARRQRRSARQVRRRSRLVLALSALRWAAGVLGRRS